MDDFQIDQPRLSNNQLPFVSLCTPTYNRRKFIPHIVEWFNNQYYPKERLEGIIIDDGTDPIGELVSSIPEVKYFYYHEKMCIGKKRNLMNSKCSGDYLVYIDDDDFYPLNRVTHAISSLLKYPNYLCAGCSQAPIYYKYPNNLLVTAGPFKKNHACAGTFAFNKKLLSNTKFDDTSEKSEEVDFLKNFTIPVLHLDPFQTIIIISHGDNTYIKTHFLKNPRFYKVKRLDHSLLESYNFLNFKKFVEVI